MVVFLVVLIGVFIILLKTPLPCIHHDGLLRITLKSHELIFLMIISSSILVASNLSTCLVVTFFLFEILHVQVTFFE